MDRRLLKLQRTYFSWFADDTVYTAGLSTAPDRALTPFAGCSIHSVCIQKGRSCLFGTHPSSCTPMKYITNSYVGRAATAIGYVCMINKLRSIGYT